MITAREARYLNPLRRHTEEYKKFLNEKITGAAKLGEDFVTIRERPYSNWLKERTLDDQAAIEVLKELRQNGFSVNYFQYDGSQFSDYGLKISWGNNAPAAE